ncbi:MAG: hypothetical protein PHQ41_00245 [Candidatus Cloacimonetes bacterium]|jgi:hypothetical protein|nr:hypothetical protein [Candidatus Cloacimonadota bacterium]
MNELLTTHHRYFRAARFCARFAANEYLIRACAHCLAKTVHPQRKLPSAWSKNLKDSKHDQLMRHRALFLDSYAMVNFYDLPRFFARAKIKIVDRDNRIAIHRENGGLILTYHHHFFNHIGPMLGSLGLNTNPLTLSFTSSPILPLYNIDLKKPIESAKSLLHGGKWLFIEPTAHSAIIRETALSVIRDRGNLLMAIDFNNIYPWGKSNSVQLAAHTIQMPTGLLNRICQLNSEASIAYIYFTPNGELELRFSSLPQTQGNLSILLNSYTKHLDELLSNDPAFWEGWHDLTNGQTSISSGLPLK